MYKGFDAVYNSDSKVLILGSFPSVKSRKNGFYYGNKQNRFWHTLELIFNEKIDDDISRKKDFLLKHNIALYDVVIESDLKGSSDEELTKSTHKISDISFLLPPYTKVEKILCNGKTAYNLLLSSSKENLPILYLPSTSPANTRFDFAVWKNELSFLCTSSPKFSKKNSYRS